MQKSEMYVFSKKQKLYFPLKRLIGIFGSLVGIIVCFTLIWWWVIILNLFATKGHPFFVQKRYGKNKKVFKMIKFRSMKIDVNPNLGAETMTNEESKKKDTWLGSFLRVSSIDETTQLLNILKGDMAFVGPRPGMVEGDVYLTKCRDSYNPSPYSVKPGITGYAQIKMQRKHTPSFKAKWDSKYVEKVSLFFDIKIFVYTIFKLFGAVKGR